MKLPCDVAALDADLSTVDALARLQLLARRRGDDVELRNGSAELWALLSLAGLENVFRGVAVSANGSGGAARRRR
jgi:hypothetical protein